MEAIEAIEGIETRETTEAAAGAIGAAPALLEGETASAAWEAIEAIALDLERRAADPPAADFSLASGTVGQALFFAYLDRVRPDEGHDDTALDLLERSIERVGQGWAKPTLYSGFAGLGWTIEHLRPLLLDADGDDPGEEVPRALLTLLRDPAPWRRSCDLISGLVGLGVYAGERGDREGGRDLLAAAVDRLAERAESGSHGITWFTPPSELPEETRRSFPAGYYNLGVAHGLPGMIAFLAAAAREGIREAEARRLADGAFAWLTAHRLPAEALSLYPFNVPADGSPARRASRLAWCYGDLGIATALLAAARSLERSDWEAEALAAGRRAAGRADPAAGVADSGLCHGAAGLAHLFHRLAAATGDAAFTAAARRWFADALARRRPGEGVGGFLVHDADGPEGGHGLAEPGFLEGAAGIGLALLAALSPVEPAWDRLLLASPLAGSGLGSVAPGVGYNRRHG